MGAKKLQTTFRTSRFGNCTFSLVLDERHSKSGRDTYTVAMRYTIDPKSWYQFVEGEYTEDEFSKVCTLNSKAVRSDLYEKKMVFDNLFNKYSNIVAKLGGNISLDRLKAVIMGVGTHKEATFMDVWLLIINRFRTENGGERYATRRAV